MVFKVNDSVGEVNSSPQAQPRSPNAPKINTIGPLPVVLAAELDKLIHSIIRLSDVDTHRVATVRQAIADGIYQPNIMRTVDQLILFESMLPISCP